MPVVSTPVGAAVDAIQRIPVRCWLGPDDDPNGYPNYGNYTDAQGAVVGALAAATHMRWDGRFGGETVRLLEAISADPTLVPADASGLDRAALIALYPAPEVQP